MIRVATLQRFPVKGLSPQSLPAVSLAVGETLPFDRAWAVENGPSGFDPTAPAHMPKIRFLTLMRQAALARLRTSFDERTCVLAISSADGETRAQGALSDPHGRHTIQDFLDRHFAHTLRGPARIVHAAGHAFTDVATKCVSLINLATVRDIETRLGVPVDPTRFRANVTIEGAPPWSEFDWPEGPVAIGEAGLFAFSRITRCAAINVDPATGERDLTLPRDMQVAFGHADCGVYLTVASPGLIRLGDVVEPGAG